MMKRIAKKTVEDQKKIGNDEKIDGIEKSDESKKCQLEKPTKCVIFVSEAWKFL